LLLLLPRQTAGFPSTPAPPLLLLLLLLLRLLALSLCLGPQS